MLKPILEIQDITKKFSNGTVALENISFELFKNDFLIVAGSNGSGKSVLMNLIAALDFPTKGKIILRGTKCGLVFQDAEAQILGDTVFEDVAFGAKNSGLKKDLLEEKVMQVLEQTGLKEKKDFSSRLLSSGEKRRLAVAGILAMDRDLIIFDEPFANLDWVGVKQVTSILKDLKEKEKTIIVLTHELEKVLALANKFIVLNNGKICFNGTPEEGLKQNLEQWNIKNPICAYNELKDLVWN